jgi:hypothetical protein
MHGQPDAPGGVRPPRQVMTMPSSMVRVFNAGLMALYCLAIFLALDFVYTRFVYEKDVSGRISNDHFHHGLRANFEGYETWGRSRIRIFTNSLGFKDAQVREVPAQGATRRILLIGDSFTEGIGLHFEDTFAGMLYEAGQKRPDKIEFLNAGVISYSPSIYYKKIKYLLDAGLRFDEVVVLPDISDVQDEATTYFCVDERPEYRRYCKETVPATLAKPTLAPVPGIRPLRAPDPPKLKDHFALTSRLLQMFWQEVDTRTGSARRFIERPHMTQRAGWTVAGSKNDALYQPLGVEGGIKRAFDNMQALADLLRSRNIPLTVAVYPWPHQIIHNDRESRQVTLWREFCEKNCKAFINLFPPVFAERDAHSDWYERIFIQGDSHYSPAGNRLLFRELAKHLLSQSPAQAKP